MNQSKELRREALIELIQKDNSKSHISQIRELYEVIEQAMQSGVSRAMIHQRLVETGMTITLRNFDQALYRIRKGKRSSS